MLLIMRLLVVLLVMRLLLLLMLLCLPCVTHTMDLMFWLFVPWCICQLHLSEQHYIGNEASRAFFVAAVSQRAASSPDSMLLHRTGISITEHLVSW